MVDSGQTNHFRTRIYYVLCISMQGAHLRSLLLCFIELSTNSNAGSHNWLSYKDVIEASYHRRRRSWLIIQHNENVKYGTC